VHQVCVQGAKHVTRRVGEYHVQRACAELVCKERGCHMHGCWLQGSGVSCKCFGSNARVM